MKPGTDETDGNKSKTDTEKEIKTYFKVPSFGKGQDPARPPSLRLGDIVQSKEKPDSVAKEGPDSGVKKGLDSVMKEGSDSVVQGGPDIDDLIMSYPKKDSGSGQMLRVRHFSPTRDYILKSVQQDNVKKYFEKETENKVAYMITGLVTFDKGGDKNGTAWGDIVALRLQKLSYRKLFGVYKVLITQNYIDGADYEP